VRKKTPGIRLDQPLFSPAPRELSASSCNIPLHWRLNCRSLVRGVGHVMISIFTRFDDMHIRRRINFLINSASKYRDMINEVTYYLCWTTFMSPWPNSPSATLPFQTKPDIPNDSIQPTSSDQRSLDKSLARMQYRRRLDCPI
jgi:hypothetical protein